MTNLDVLLLKGPPNGDVEGGLNELRFTILTQGIPANSEGMVSELVLDLKLDQFGIVNFCSVPYSYLRVSF